MFTVGILLTSCTSSDDVKNTDSARTITTPNAHRYFYDNGGTDYGCKQPAVNCLDDVIVNGKMSISNFKDRIISQKSLDLLDKVLLTLENKDNTSTSTEYFILRKKVDNSIYEVYPTKYN